MGADNILPVKGVKITLGGEEKTLIFKMESIAILAKKYGGTLKVFDLFQGMMSGELAYENLIAMSDLISCGLMFYHPEITSESIMHNYDFDDLSKITKEVVQAFMESIAGFRASKVETENPPKV